MSTTPTATGTNLQISTDAQFSNIVNEDDGTYRTTQPFSRGALPYNKTLYCRVRHSSDVGGISKWSKTVSFQVQPPDDIIGVAINNSNSSSKGTVFWIDANGNKLSSFNAYEHPTWKGCKMVTVDSRAPVTLTAIPRFYIKTAASGPAGSDAAGLKCWWLSPTPEDGFRPHPAFKRSASNLSDYCYIGTYLGHAETVSSKTCLGSKVGQTVLANTTKDAFRTYITNRNNSSYVTGMRMFDIYDLSVMRWLALIHWANTDTQTTYGDNAAGTAYPKTGSTNARMWFNSAKTVTIEDCWRCYWYHADLITVNNGVVSLNDPRDTSKVLSFGSAETARYRQPTSSGWIRDVLDCPYTIGSDVHDLMELFLPGSITSSESLGTFSDYHYVPSLHNQVYIVVGHRWGYGGDLYWPGVFYSDWWGLGTSYQLDVGCRLSKT